MSEKPVFFLFTSPLLLFNLQCFTACHSAGVTISVTLRCVALCSPCSPCSLCNRITRNNQPLTQTARTHTHTQCSNSCPSLSSSAKRKQRHEDDLPSGPFYRRRLSCTLVHTSTKVSRVCLLHTPR